MNELYAEATARRKVTAGIIALKAIAIIAILMIIIASVFVSGAFGRIMVMLGAAGAVVLFWYWPRFKTVWEYVYCDGQLDFDMIMGGEKRKSVLRIEIEEADIVTKLSSPKMDGYRHLKVKDFSSMEKDADVYAVVTKQGEEKVVILFEPTQKMVDMMHTKSPNIVEI